MRNREGYGKGGEGESNGRKYEEEGVIRGIKIRCTYVYALLDTASSEVNADIMCVRSVLRDVRTYLPRADEFAGQCSSEAPADESGFGQWVAQFYIFDRTQLVMHFAEQFGVELVGIFLTHGSK